MEITSFSATIVIKNSLAKDKNGNPLSLPLVNHNFVQTKSDIERLLHQENAIKSLESNLENALYDYEQISETKDSLEKVIDNLHTKLAASDQKNVELSKAGIEYAANLEIKVKHQEQKEAEMATINDKLSDAVKKLRNERNDSIMKAKSELALVKKEFKEDIKAWRRELGEERKNKTKLENKLEKMKQKREALDNIVDSSNTASKVSAMVSFPKDPEITCTICAEPITDYMPKYFNGTEINPACNNCQDRTSWDSIPSDTSCLDSTSMVTTSLDTICLGTTSMETTSMSLDKLEEVDVNTTEVSSSQLASQHNSSRSLTSPASTASTRAPPPVTSRQSQRIQCDKCPRKCVNKEDMECHNLLWQSDPQTQTFLQILMPKKNTATED